MLLYLNPLAAIICPDLDAINGHETIVQNPISEEVFKIDKNGYLILKQIYDQNGIGMGELLKDKSQRKFVELMLNENVLIEKRG